MDRKLSYKHQLSVIGVRNDDVPCSELILCQMKRGIVKIRLNPVTSHFDIVGNYFKTLNEEQILGLEREITRLFYN